MVAFGIFVLSVCDIDFCFWCCCVRYSYLQQDSMALVAFVQPHEIDTAIGELTTPKSQSSRRDWKRLLMHNDMFVRKQIWSLVSSIPSALNTEGEKKSNKIISWKRMAQSWQEGNQFWRLIKSVTKCYIIYHDNRFQHARLCLYITWIKPNQRFDFYRCYGGCCGMRTRKRSVHIDLSHREQLTVITQLQQNLWSMIETRASSSSSPNNFFMCVCYLNRYITNKAQNKQKIYKLESQTKTSVSYATNQKSTATNWAAREWDVVVIKNFLVFLSFRCFANVSWKTSWECNVRCEWRKERENDDEVRSEHRVSARLFRGETKREIGSSCR